MEGSSLSKAERKKARADRKQQVTSVNLNKLTPLTDSQDH